MSLDPQPLAPALAAAAEAGWTTVRLDLAGVHSKDALLDRCAGALGLPQWFGRNWDALADCLVDLSWLAPAPGRLLAVTSWRAYARERPVDWETFEDILGEAEEFWRESGEGPLEVLLEDRPAGREP
ncbi:barstar family protein [Streptomyces bambusae]|uniref:Barstar (barnase inhibitor) domain-containing protein n=1 Tax=Streptomyces bambusae TaxID=1550616 RepID=A0ABS6ZEQ8_9ACTN|nr:barstar family protein [Streptomyces bambusae]MBW5486250.1 hypothetical protein [Streptomyces bambusae]